jgi:hypothetical protein
LFLGLGILIPLLLLSCGDRDERTSGETSTVSASDTIAGPVDSVVIRLTGVDSLTVLDLLLQEHEVQYKSTAMGIFVSAIDSFESGSGVYWLYSVNDTFPQVASDKMVTGDSDRVVWHFRKTWRE